MVPARQSHSIEHKMGRTASGNDTINALVDAVVADIAAAGLNPGDLIGREADLCQRYGVSAALFRQAARLMEVREVARMRAGKFGGLVVGHGSLERAGRVLATHLESIGLDNSSLLPIGRCLSFLSARQAIDAMSSDDAERLRFRLAEMARAEDMYDYSRRNIALSQAVAESTGNALIELFIAATLGALYHLTPQHVPLEQEQLDSLAPHGIIEAMIAGDVRQAFLLLAKRWEQIEMIDLLKVSDLVKAVPPPEFRLAGAHARTRSERLAHELMAEIRREAWPVGRKLGNEPELLQRYDVSRGVFRQAVRLLEEFGAVTMRRGKQGGLIVASPNPNSIDTLAGASLRARDPSVDDIKVVLQELVPLSLDLLRADQTGMDKALCAAQACIAVGEGESAQVVCRALADASGNRALSFFLNIIFSLGGIREPEREEIGRAVHRELLGFIDAIQSRWTTGARRHLIVIAALAAGEL